MGKNAWAVAEEVCLRIDDSPVPQGYISAILVDRPENQFFYNREYLGVTNNQKSSVPGHEFFFKLKQFESLHCGKGEPYMEYKRMSCQELNGKLCKFCEKDETTSAPLPTRRPYPDDGKLPNFHYLSWSATPTKGREPDHFQPRAQISDCLRKVNQSVGTVRLLGSFQINTLSPKSLWQSMLSTLPR